MNRAPRFARRARRLLLAWLALIALMLASLGSAYLPLHGWNAVIGLGVAAVKAGIVLWCFMRLGDASALMRIAAAAALFALALLFGLSELDDATRSVESATVQQPRQIAPLNRQPQKQKPAPGRFE